jgi:hypothetical protein
MLHEIQQVRRIGRHSIYRRVKIEPGVTRYVVFREPSGNHVFDARTLRDALRWAERRLKTCGGRRRRP